MSAALLRNHLCRWTALAGGLVTAIAVTIAWRHERDAHASDIAHLAQDRLQAVNSHIEQGALALHLLAAFHAASARIAAPEFDRFAGAILAGGYGARWIALVDHTRTGEPGATLVRPDHWTDTVSGLPWVPGSPNEREAARLHVDGASAWLHLARVVDARGRADGRSVQLAVALDLREIVESARRHTRRIGMHVAARALPDGPFGLVPSRITGDGPPPADWVQRAEAGARMTTRLADLTLDLRAFADPAIAAPSRQLSLIIGALGVLFTAAVSWTLRGSERRRRHIESVVATRTRELAEANALLETRVVERTRQLAAANQELEAFNWSVSHDLHAPLRAIDGFAGILVEDHAAQLPSAARRLIGVIRDGCADMSRLIDALLWLSRAKSQPLLRIDLDVDAMVHEIHDELRRAGLVADGVVRIGPLGRVCADPTLLREVFRNLLANAAKFSAQTASPRIEVARTDADGLATFAITDNGVGFDAADADRLFAPFARLHPHAFAGTGIGLAVCQRIITRHGGTIGGRGTRGGGATFCFDMPSSVSPAAKATNP